MTTPPALSPDQPPQQGQTESAAAIADLTPRQTQILELLRDGKGNKEIAYELGINIGTVKQHVVALFKKLNVRNRTMAVAKTFGPQTAPSSSQAATQDLTAAISHPNSIGQDTDTVLEKRPCVILSLAISAPAAMGEHPPVDDQALRAAARHLHTSLAALAYDHDAVFLARRGNAADVIFGVQRTREFDLLRALRTAQAVAEALTETIPAAAPFLRGGLTASLAVASMLRQGGWSGEAIASAGISTARTLADNAPTGTLNLGPTAQDLMIAHGIGGGPDGVGQMGSLGENRPLALPFDQLHQVRATESAATMTLRGRLTELSTLFNAWTETPAPDTTVRPPVVVLGEAGMGKSHLSLTFAQRSRKDGATLILRRCQPSDGTGREPFLACDETGHDHSLQDVLALLTDRGTTSIEPNAPLERQLVVLDDVHWLSAQDQQRLFAAACTYRPGRMVILVARRLPSDLLNGRASGGTAPITLRLGRLPPDITESVAADRLLSASPLPANTLKATGKGIAGRAMGVPLFAVELARHWKSLAPLSPNGSSAPPSPLWASTPPLSLLTIVCARLDSQGLDRHMLRALARAPRAVDGVGLALLMRETPSTLAPTLERAIKAGVLAFTAEGTLTFTHPLLRAVVDFLGMD